MLGSVSAVTGVYIEPIDMPVAQGAEVGNASVGSGWAPPLGQTTLTPRAAMPMRLAWSYRTPSPRQPAARTLRVEAGFRHTWVCYAFGSCLRLFHGGLEGNFIANLAVKGSIGKGTGAPLLLTRHTVAVAIHLRARAILQE